MSLPEEACPACGSEVLDIDVSCEKCGYALSSTGAQRLIGEVVLGQYTISDILGQGGMSVVYRGKHAVTGQEVALKVLPPDLAAYRDVKSRFLEEGRALAQLDHPNIVHLYNFGSDGDSLILAMQFVRGKTWERVILEEGKLSWQRSAQLTCDVARALDYAHGRGIVHRDMKPSNVLLRELDGAATVMDFGIAKMQSSTKLTATGQTMGTVRYMSPEQVRGKSVDERTDIYSLAVTAYESVVGDTPFTGDTHFEIMSKHLSEAPVAPSERGVDLPPAFEAVLMRALSKAPEDRQSTAKQFTEQIEAALAGNASAGDAMTGAQPLSFAATVAAKAAKDPAAALRDATPTVPSARVHNDDDIESLPLSSRKGVYAAVALAVLGAAAATYFATKGGSKDTREIGGVSQAPVADAAPKSRADLLKGAFLMPGLSFTVDETFEADGLRILAVGETDVPTIRIMVLKARATYAGISKELGWPKDENGEVLSVVLVPQSTICNPSLYEDGVVRDGCKGQATYIRPVESTLYVVPDATDDMQGLLDYWVAASRCIRGDVADCTDVIQTRLGG